MPVRDALLRLTHEGYLVGTTRGFMLPDLGPETIMEFFEIRRLLEPRAAALAARELTDEALERMREAVAQSRSTLDSTDIERFYQASESFRDCWLSAVPNSELRGIVQRYLLHVQAVRMATMRDRASHEIIVAGQEGLLASFVRRDPIAAGDRMLRFVVDGETCYLRSVQPNPPAGAPGWPAPGKEF